MSDQHNSFVDNRDENTMVQAVRQAFGLDTAAGNATPSAQPDEVRIASTFFSPAGFRLISSALEKIPTVRLMLGVDMPSNLSARRRPIGETEERWLNNRLQSRLDKQRINMEQERNLLPFSTEYNHALRVLVSALRQGNLEVRRYEKSFMHAKAYIFSNKDEGGLLAGSSNLTQAGFTTNVELNLGRFDQPTWHKAVAWFDELWEGAQPLELAELYEASLMLDDPWYVFLRVLYQLYGEELEFEQQTGDGDLALTTFQKHGVARTNRLIKENGGAIVADEVGLGKTFIAGEILTQYIERGQRALLICPASLRESTWKNFLTQYQVHCECYSYHELGNDEQLVKDKSKGKKHLQMSKESYQLVLIDEAHNYRNPAAPTRAGVLRELLAGRKKELLMLTATPVNNSLWDLYTLLTYFIRQDSYFIDRNIHSMRGLFKQAMSIDAANLHPDMLYPIIDATTVKRTRQFVQTYYAKDTIKTADGETEQIIFPDPIPKTVRYDLDQTAPGLMEKIFKALDPDAPLENPETLTLARYKVQAYISDEIPEKDKELLKEATASPEAVAYLIRSALLKRFESSVLAFRKTLNKIQKQYNTCWGALNEGRVVSTAFLSEISGEDETALEELLERTGHSYHAKNFDGDLLREHLRHDRKLLRKLIKALEAVTPEKDAKLIALRTELEQIAEEAQQQATSTRTEGDLRKVLIFSSFADTVDWVGEFLEKEVRTNPKLKNLQGRVRRVTGRKGENYIAPKEAAYGFAPLSMSVGKTAESEDLYDILVTTDVLAEGVNLQQCRHIINYDLPWNPMRLVQRHGRIDRIGSRHSRVYLRSIFPDKHLDELLHLEQRIMEKIAMASAAIGVQGGPVKEADISGNQVFTETREEIEKLLAENPELYERGGTVSATQSGEEYRQILRDALQTDSERIINMPWKVGSSMTKGRERGVFFCADIDGKPYLCFVRADEDWQPRGDEQAIEAQLGTCLRLIEAKENTPLLDPMPIDIDEVCAFWDKAQEHFYADWTFKTKPANLTLPTKPLNREVIEFLKKHKPNTISDKEFQDVIKVLKSEWNHRDARELRRIYEAYQDGKKGPEILINWIKETGIPPLKTPEPYPPIDRLDIKLVCWMVIEPEIQAEPSP